MPLDVSVFSAVGQAGSAQEDLRQIVYLCEVESKTQPLPSTQLLGGLCLTASSRAGPKCSPGEPRACSASGNEGICRMVYSKKNKKGLNVEHAEKQDLTQSGQH